MWREYASSSMKNNRSAGLSITIAALIAALLLSLLCGIFYNAWKYEVERVQLEEGNWHSRIIGELSETDLETIRNYANVQKVSVHASGDKGTGPTVDIIFRRKSAAFSDMPKMAAQLGIPQERVQYHYELLALYLIRDAGDTAPRLLFPVFLLITVAASFSLILIIHNAFAVSMQARVHQFGILSSIGATPKQIWTGLLQEAAVLCIGPVFVGNLLGIAGSAGITVLSNTALGNAETGRHTAVFGYHPLVLLLTVLVTILTIWVSAWLPARKLSRLTPLQAIQNTGELQLKRKKNSRLLSLLFGVEGELAGNALKAQKKALRTASLSLLLSFLAFVLMQCVFTLSQISTRETYFERYQDVWDVMVTLPETEIGQFADTETFRGLAGVESAIVYQRTAAKCLIPDEQLSGEMQAMGGFSGAAAEYVVPVNSGWLVNAPIVVLDDDSFSAYCRQIGITPSLDGAVVLNQIRDVSNPDFRHPVFLPYLKENSGVTVLQQSAGASEMAEIPVLAYTQEVPPLREEYAKEDYYELVHFVPMSLWSAIQGQVGGAPEDCAICIRGGEGVSLEELNAIQHAVAELLQGKYPAELENRIQEQRTNDTQIQGMRTVFGGFCVLLALIGIGNVFSNTLGFVRQRRREFARYMSVGLTPRELKKMFCTEAMVLAGKPILISLVVTVPLVGVLIQSSYMDVGTFLGEAPLLPIGLLLLAIAGSVALAYGLAWRQVSKISLPEVLRDDSLL